MTYHDELVEKIKKNATSIFREVIHWENIQLPGEARNMPVDLTGIDAKGNRVIVEVKPFDGKPSRYDKPREAVGQILHYATAYLQRDLQADPRDLSEKQLREGLKKIRLFIVSDVYEPTVEKICTLLKAHGITITYISLDSVYRKEIVW